MFISTIAICLTVLTGVGYLAYHMIKASFEFEYGDKI